MATPEQKWPRRSSVTRSPDTVSPLWPDRPIRPLPKNPLRSKLSSTQAEKIEYPPKPPKSSPLFSFPYGPPEEPVARPDGRTNGHRHSSPTHCDCGNIHRNNSDEEDEGPFDHPSYRWSSPDDGSDHTHPRGHRAGGRSVPGPPSIASSADGYESFENTNNKKKRKIPLSSGFSVHQSVLSADLANMGLSSPVGAGETAEINGGGQAGYSSSQHALGGSGVSGAGRARHSRHGVKGDKRTGINGTMPNGYASSLSARSRGGDFRGDGTRPRHNGDQGIISAAIANAAGQPTTPSGKENTSLLSQESEKSTTPKSQFTFTCETDASSKISWPLKGAGQYNGSASKKPYYPIRQRPGEAGSTSQGTQTYISNRAPSDPKPAAAGPPPPANSQTPVNGQAPAPRPRRRRRRSQEYAQADRQRKIHQQFTNFQNKPTRDTMSMCILCEYELVYGERPVAWDRWYADKEAKEKAEADERARLLEKAKMKGKKGKSKGKGKKNSAPPAVNDQLYSKGVDNNNHGMAQKGAEYYDDEYDDGYGPIDGQGPVYDQDHHYDDHAGHAAGQHIQAGHVAQAGHAAEAAHPGNAAHSEHAGHAVKGAERPGKANKAGHVGKGGQRKHSNRGPPPPA